MASYRGLTEIRIAGFVLLAIVLLGAVVIAVPIVTGYEIDCDFRGEPIDQDECEKAWDAMKDDLGFDHELGMAALLPITGVTIHANSPEWPWCASWTVHRYGIFDMAADQLC